MKILKPKGQERELIVTSSYMDEDISFYKARYAEVDNRGDYYPVGKEYFFFADEIEKITTI